MFQVWWRGAITSCCGVANTNYDGGRVVTRCGSGMAVVLQAMVMCDRCVISYGDV